MKHLLLLILIASVFVLPPPLCRANPTQFGDSGLFTQPSAETLSSGNICIGLWGNHSSGDSADATIVPVAITLGLGTFLEAYGSYPNLLFNDDELQSGRGYANTGFKLRIWGKRSDPFKVALDGHARRTISEDPALDGLTDYLGRLIVSFKMGKFGIHANVGQLEKEDPEEGPEFEDQILYGGGIEFFPSARLRLIAEMAAESEKFKDTEESLEGTLGFQYFLSPHLTFNLGVGAGFTDAAPDWRLLLGFSTCQGIGTYTKPIPKIVQPAEEEAKKAEEAKVKKIKVKTLTPLIPKAKPIPASPVSKLEVPVEPNEEEIVVDPSERLQIPDSKKQKPLPISPIGGDRSVKTTIVEEPVIALVHRKFRLPEFTFGFNQSGLSEDGKKALSQIMEQLRKEDRLFFIRVDGHTDNVGSETYNNRLSLIRAISAATHLVLRDGFDPGRMFVKGLGESQPLASNDTEAGRAENRRIEILVLVPKGVGP